MHVKLRIAGGGLDDGALRRKITLEHGKGAFVVDRLVERADDVIVVDFGPLQALAQRLAGHGDDVTMELAAQPFHEGAKAAGIVEVLHEIGLARGPDVGDHRRHAALGVQVIECQLNAGAARHGDEMDDGVGGAAGRHGHGDSVLDRPGCDDLVRRQVLPDHLHGAPPTGSAHALVVGIGGGNGAGSRQAQAHGFGNRRHGAGRAHGHTVTVRPGNAAFDAGPLFLGDRPGAALVPVLEGVRSGPKLLALVVAAQHRSGGQIDEGIACRHGPHHEARGGLVAAAHEHRAVDRMRAQQFLRLHGQHVAVEHGGRLHVAFRQRQGRKLQGIAAGLPDALLHMLDALLEMHVTGIGVRPGVEDGDDGLSFPVGRTKSHLHGTRAVAEGAQVIRRKPSRAAQLIVRLAGHSLPHVLVLAAMPRLFDTLIYQYAVRKA